MIDKERPAEPVVDDTDTPRTGGFAKVAEQLNKDYPVRRRPISRQLVHKWWICRHSNGFPEATAVRGSASGGRGRPVFDLDEVDAWYVKYSGTRLRVHGGRPQTQPTTASETTATDSGDTLAA